MTTKLEQVVSAAQAQIAAMTEEYIREHGHWPIIRSRFDEATKVMTFEAVSPQGEQR